jgi:hypothetical protein
MTPTAKPWTTSRDLRGQVQSIWERGRILSAAVTGEGLFPLTLKVSKPETAALGRSFEAVRNWIRELEDNSRAREGFGYDIEWTDINHRQIGRNRMPGRILVPTETDALRLIGKERDCRLFRKLAQATVSQFPALAPWVSHKPFVLLQYAGEWPRILAVLAWFRAHPRSNLYLRQLDIPGVDTKFIEARKPLFSELLDTVLERGGDQPPGVTLSFEAKYGLREKPAMVRFRILDPGLAIAGLTDITVPAGEFAVLNIAARYVFITENEVNGLAFPDFTDAIVVFGLGYSVDLLQAASWLARTEIYYWGDIDTHGFAILDRLRSMFPGARSLLMDRETFAAHRELSVQELTPSRAHLSRLNPEEQALFDDLVHDRLGEKMRLEQERLAYAFLERSLKAIRA